MEVVVPAFLPKLQMLCDYVSTRQMGVFFVTNYYETIDRAILRGGRINHHILVLPYSRESKKQLLKKSLLKHWGNGHKLPISAEKKLDQIVAESDSLQCYREVEQIKDAIRSHWKKPSDKRPPQVDKAMYLTSIIPEIYNPKKRNGAFHELHAILDRRMGKLTPEDDRLQTADGASDYLTSFIAQEKDAQWKSIAEKWKAELGKKDH